MSTKIWYPKDQKLQDSNERLIKNKDQKIDWGLGAISLLITFVTLSFGVPE